MTLRAIKPRTLTIRLAPLSMWRDDMERIESIIVGAGKEVTITTDSYVLDKVADLGKMKEKRIRKLVFEANEGRVRVIFGASGGSITIFEPSLRERGMAAELEEVSRRCQKIGSSWMPVVARTPLRVAGLSVALVAFLAYLFWSLASLGSKLQVPGEGSSVGAVWIALLLSIPSAAFGILWSTNILRTGTRSEAPTWLRRNSDALVTNAIVSAVFLVIGYWVGKVSE
ncbi:hypothetical protein [Micromonospora wenchangensis]|uniref:hypothetical protein n=1 Tax=Micromonospora wenchangensis TaxID=1185415 RepID=UPI003829A532